MKVFSTNPKHNKALLLLASMSPDMVSDIIAVVNARGSAILSDISDPAGPPKALALLSRDFVDDSDFPEVHCGLMLTYLAAFRQPADRDFYERILMDGAHAPEVMAKRMAKTIETWDPIEHEFVDGKKISTVRWVWRKAQETVRDVVNYLPNLFGFGWENDQDQAFDFDRLYEMKLLGRAVDELASRSRLMTGQARLLSSMGISPSGDVTGDPIDQEEIKLIAATRPLVGAPLPNKFFGLLQNFVKEAKKFNLSNFEDKLKDAGMHPQSKTAANPATAAAAQRLLSDDQASIEPLVRDAVTTESMGDVVQANKSRAAYGLTDSALDQIAEQFGETVAEAVSRGEMGDALDAVLNEAGSGLLTTGDPALDADIVGEVMDEIGDAYSDLNPEIGALGIRARINRKMKKAAKIRRKNSKKQAKRAALKKADNSLNAARYAEAAQEEEDYPTYESDGEGDYQQHEDNGDQYNDMSQVDISQGLEV